VIGRAPDADLVLDQESVAPRHVGLSRRDGELFAEDLGTRRRPYDLDPPSMVGWPIPPRSRYGRGQAR
jgi:pSer/pThr/pTyr-binding forkhead associated (FHA) protein